jgi:hypothetical protein
MASSDVGPCGVPFRYFSRPIPRYRGTVARWHALLRGLATEIHEISGLVLESIEGIIIQLLHRVQHARLDKSTRSLLPLGIY